MKKEKIIKKQEIIHLYGASDYTLCGFGSETLDDFGVPPDDNYEDLILPKTIHNTNCRLCQERVIDVLDQIKRKRIKIPNNK